MAPALCRLLISYSFFCLLTVTAQSPLFFQVTSGGNDNYVFRDNTTSAQLLLTSVNNTQRDDRRLVIASPAGNTGALVFFLPSNGSNSTSETPRLSASLVDRSITSISKAEDNVGIQADLLFTGNATLGVTIIGAVRAMRDFVEGSGTMHEIFNYTLHSFNSTSVRLHRRCINSTEPGSDTFKSVDLYLSCPQSSDLSLSITPAPDGSIAPPNIQILAPVVSSNRSLLRVQLVSNETSLTGLDPEELFLNEDEASTPDIKTLLQNLHEDDNSVLQQVAFLSYAETSLAGGWRFLTYFGRDTLIALRLLMPVLRSEAIESVLGAVIERANSTGALCHEETKGDYASFINLQNNRPDLGNTPFYDYKMIDTDLLLLPALSHYFFELPQGKDRQKKFLAKTATLRNGTYAEILARIAKYNLNRALPFFFRPIVSNLLTFRPGQPVGNWRDSNQGTGYGRIPFDVNSALVPASLRATQALVQAGILPEIRFGDLDIHEQVQDVGTKGATIDIGAVADVWERKAAELFEVKVSRNVSEARLEDYVKKAGLDGILNVFDAKGSESGSRQDDGVSFYALSLRDDGSRVEVLNSDIGFNLMYGSKVSMDFLQRVIDALVPYPRGLLTNIGMVIANPAYDSNRTNLEVFDRTVYHGTVIWSFQQGLLAGGLARQLALCSDSASGNSSPFGPKSSKPEWCTDKAFVQDLQQAQTRLWNSINGARSVLNTEVWSYEYNSTSRSFYVADLVALTPDGTEADAIQLWSFGFLGLLDPTRR